MGKLIDLTGKRFGHWLVLIRTTNSKIGHPRWLCRCDCGREKIVQGGNLRNGGSKSCQNCQNKGNYKHGLRRTRLYNVWANIIKRCENPNATHYERYGGRGIRICSEWRKRFMVFRRWALSHGYKDGLTIDRIDNDGNYEPSNCQFITRGENTWKGWHVDGSYKKRT